MPYEQPTYGAGSSFKEAPTTPMTAVPGPPPIPPAPGFPPSTPYQGATSTYPAQQVPAPAKPKKKSKKSIFIIVGAVLLVALIAVGSVIGYNVYRENNYNKALEMLESGDYQGAYDAFGELGDYEDSADWQILAQKWMDYESAVALFDSKDYKGALLAFTALGGFEDSAEYITNCERNITYLDAIADYEAGSYDKALDAFLDLASIGFSDSKEWINKTKYAIANEKFEEGDLYGAYKDFKALGTYDDSADRMKGCTTPFPKTGELYHNGNYVSNRSAIAIDAGNALFVSFFKIYDGDKLVSTIWLNPGGKVTIEVPAGTYTIKEAVGSVWFGEEVMFGDEGDYKVLLFDDKKPYTVIGDNIILTITLSVSGGNTGSSDVPQNKF
jgi:tetratricopeptide (TPR) repeat protein